MNQTTKKWSSILLSIVCTATILVGCGSNETESSNAGSSGATNNEVVKLTMMTWEGKEMTAAIQEAIKKFESDNPGIKVEVLPTPLADYTTKINSLISINK